MAVRLFTAWIQSRPRKETHVGHFSHANGSTSLVHVMRRRYPFHRAKLRICGTVSAGSERKLDSTILSRTSRRLLVLGVGTILCTPVSSTLCLACSPPITCNT